MSKTNFAVKYAMKDENDKVVYLNEVCSADDMTDLFHKIRRALGEDVRHADGSPISIRSLVKASCDFRGEGPLTALHSTNWKNDVTRLFVVREIERTTGIGGRGDLDLTNLRDGLWFYSVTTNDFFPYHEKNTKYLKEDGYSVEFIMGGNTLWRFTIAHCHCVPESANFEKVAHAAITDRMNRTTV